MNEDDEMDLLRDELKQIIKQFENEMSGVQDEEDLEVINGVNLKELEKVFEQKQPKLELKFIKCHVDAVIPHYAYPSDSGFDLHSTESVGIPPLSRMIVGTGLKFNI